MSIYLDASHFAAVCTAMQAVFHMLEDEGLEITLLDNNWHWRLQRFDVECDSAFSGLDDCLTDVLAFRMMRPSSAVPVRGF